MPSKIERYWHKDKISYITMGESCGNLGEEFLAEIGILADKMSEVHDFCHKLNISDYDGFKTLVETKNGELSIQWRLSDSDIFLLAWKFAPETCWATWGKSKGETTHIAFEKVDENEKIKVKLNLTLEQGRELLVDRWVFRSTDDCFRPID